MKKFEASKSTFTNEHNGKKAEVHWDNDWEEHIVKFYQNSKYLGAKADYHATDKEDATGTAKHWCDSPATTASPDKKEGHKEMANKNESGERQVPPEEITTGQTIILDDDDDSMTVDLIEEFEEDGRKAFEFFHIIDKEAVVYFEGEKVKIFKQGEQMVSPEEVETGNTVILDDGSEITVDHIDEFEEDGKKAWEFSHSLEEISAVYYAGDTVRVLEQVNESFGYNEPYDDYADWKQAAEKLGLEVFAKGAADGNYEARKYTGTEFEVYGRFFKNTSEGWIHSSASAGDKKESFGSVVNQPAKKSLKATFKESLSRMLTGKSETVAEEGQSPKSLATRFRRTAEADRRGSGRKPLPGMARGEPDRFSLLSARELELMAGEYDKLADAGVKKVTKQQIDAINAAGREYRKKVYADWEAQELAAKSETNKKESTLSGIQDVVDTISKAGNLKFKQADGQYVAKLKGENKEEFAERVLENNPTLNASCAEANSEYDRWNVTAEEGVVYVIIDSDGAVTITQQEE